MKVLIFQLTIEESLPSKRLFFTDVLLSWCCIAQNEFEETLK